MYLKRRIRELKIVSIIEMPGSSNLRGKRQLGRPRHGWEGNIKMDLQEVGCGCMDWIDLV
jgi:hypothetical protein